MSLDKDKSIHFVGIGGIGMSGIARVLLDMGHKVSGSDLELNDLTRKIERRGGKVYCGHSGSNIPDDAGLVVYSSSIGKSNVELKEAYKRGVRVVHRAEMLGELFNVRKGIAVSGMHGKTTTTSLISVMLKGAGLDPTVIIGGEVSQFEGNANLGKAGIIAAEADESDSSFIHLNPYYAVITNIEMEHLDHFKSLDDIKSAYRSFINNLKKGGRIFYNMDDPNVRAVVKDFPYKSSSFGFSEEADLWPTEINMKGFKSSFLCMSKGKALGKIELNIPGRHNILNALAAISVGLELGIKFDTIAPSLAVFSGAKRRFQLRYDAGGVMLIEDYAHHPTEVKAVLDACKNWEAKRIVAVFQPHRYSRTKFLLEEFGRCFNGVDKLILTDIYAASESPIKGVSVKNIYNKVRQNGISDVEIVKKDRIAGRIIEIQRPGDMILLLGAGDIKLVADTVVEKLNGRISESPAGTAGRSVTDRLKRYFKGKLVIDEPLKAHTSFKIGGPASIWSEPADIYDLKRALSFARSRKISFFVIGNGSNLLASDKGFGGMLIHLGSDNFRKIKVLGKTVQVGGGFSLPKLIIFCCQKGLAGMESLVGIPGTVGGAIYMNAGGYTNPIYRNIGDLVRSLKVMDYNGKIEFLKASDIKFGYRSSGLKGKIILEAVLKLSYAESKYLVSSCSGFLKIKRDKQVLDLPSAGCVFKNPPQSQFTCGQMIEMVGLKGRRIGGAEISAKHANFIVNRGNATSRDVMDLVELIKTEIRKNYGIELELEVMTI